MKQLGRQILLLVISTIGLVSCNSSFWVSIETRHPAKITFPQDVNNVLVVNNAVTQPSEFGTEVTLRKVKIKNPFQLEMDSTLWTAVSAIEHIIRDTRFFNNVMLSKKPVRDDSQWIKIEPITEVECRSLYEENGTDAIISIDRLLLKMNQDVNPTFNDYFLDPTYSYQSMKLGVKLQCSVYLRGRSKSLTSFSVEDSLFFNSIVSCDSIALYKTMPNAFLRQAAYNIAELAASYFTPGWITSDRLVHSNGNARMREAGEYSKKDKWNEAKLIWVDLYQSKNNSLDKARLAMNIALANEMQDQLETALDWATRAREYYKQLKQGKVTEEIKYIDLYIEALQKRIHDNRLLDFQMSVEEY